MKIDEHIKSELENESAQIDAILQDKQGLFEMLWGTFSSGLGRWVILINNIILIVTGVMFWTGYKFFTSDNTMDYVYWGVCLLLSASVQIATKMWIFMEMHRGSLIREIKRVEVAVARLSAKVESRE